VNQKGYTTIELIVAVTTILVLCIMVYGGYVLHHFITKYW